MKFKSIKVHKCEICGLVVKGAPTLENHMISLHTDQRPNQCTQCTSAFKTLTDLRKHIRRVHDLQRNAQCTMCPKSKS